MNTNTYLEVLCESASNTDPNLNPVIEGKTWDKVKKVWRDHKGKIIAGAALAAGAAGAAAAYSNKKDEERERYAAQSAKLNREARAKEKAEADADAAKTKARQDARWAESDKKYKDYKDTNDRAAILKRKSGHEKYVTNPDMGENVLDNDKVAAGQKIIKQINKDNDDRYNKMMRAQTQKELERIRNSNKKPAKVFTNNTPDKGSPEPGLGGMMSSKKKYPKIKESLSALYKV